MSDEKDGTHGTSQSELGRCLADIRILLVDDSRSVSEAIRIMATRSGARIRRADTIKAAERHLTIYRPEVVIIDLGLPDGNGADLAAEIVAWPAPRPSVLIISASEEEVLERAVAAAGADGYIVKPISSFADFQRAVLDLIPEDFRPPMDGIGNITARQIGDDAYLHDLLNAQDLLKEAIAEKNVEAMEFAAHFLLGVARTLQDGVLISSATSLLAAADAQSMKDAADKTILSLDKKIAAGWAQAS